jgi:urate oxidase
MKLLRNSYGKARVRVMKVTRQGNHHSVKELDVSVMLEGRFAASYTGSDNRLVIATDSMKNTVNVLAQKFLGADAEEFGVKLAEHFLKTYRHVDKTMIRLRERCWQRMTPRGRPHLHSFTGQETSRPVAEITATRKGTEVKSGIENLLVLKTTASGFEGFLRDEFTTLRETGDRLLCTKVNAVWTYAKKPSSYAKANGRILEALLEEFSAKYSPSVQVTLYEMGKAALKSVPQISQISLAMPNQHCLPIDLSPFGISTRNELFVPTDEPHGQIEGTVVR